MEIANHEYYVSLEVAKLLKEAGFDWKCRGIYVLDSENDPEYVFSTANFTNTSKEIEGYIRLSSPTLDIAQRWLRETKDFHIFVDYENNIYQCRIDQMEHIYYVKHQEWLYNNAFNEFSTYEEAQEAGIKKALEIILEKGE